MMDLRQVAAHYGGRASSSGQCNIPTPGHSTRDLGTSLTVNDAAPDGLLVKVHNGNDADALAVKDVLRRDGFLPPRDHGNDNAHRSDPALPDKWRVPIEAGFSVIPVQPRGKLPIGSWKAFQRQRANPGQVKQWAARESNVGIVTGEVSGIFVLDIDNEAAMTEARKRGLPDTVTARTANGLHFYFRHPGEPVKTCKGFPFPGADIRGDGGFVVAPGSVHPDGPRYEWQQSPADVRIADAPNWLLEELGALLPFPTIDLADLSKRKAEPQRFTIERIAPAGEVTLFTGPGSGGKSLLGQQFATAAAAGLPCLGLDVQPGPAIYLTCEDKPGQLEWRQEHICASLGVDMASIAGKLHLVSLRGALDNELATFAADGTIELAPAYHRLAKMIRATGSQLIFLDNVAHLFTGNENDRGDVTRFINVLNRLASETGASILLIAHPSKPPNANAIGHTYSGSTAWLNAVRSQITLDHVRESNGTILDPDARVLSVGKANYARKGEAVRFRWHEWAYVLEADLPPDTAKEIAETIKANADNELFLRCLRLRNEQERPVSESEYSRTFAPLVFAQMAESKRIGRHRLEAAMDRLFRIEKIARGVVCRAGGKDREGLVERCADLCADPPLTPPADLSRQGAPTSPTHTPIDKSITGAARGSAAPADDDLDWSDGEGLSDD